MRDNRLDRIIIIVAAIFAISIIFCLCAVGCAGRKGRETDTVRVAQKQTESSDTAEEQEETVPAVAEESGGKIIVLDAGHGKPSQYMSVEERSAEGYMYNDVTGGWGEWRHYKDGTFGEDCFGSECTLTAPHGGSCWYPIENSDRGTEPEINLNNALAAKAYLEKMGYEVHMTRTTNDEAPSMNKRVSYCFPDNDITQSPDAALYVCIHSNAGGGSGTSYIELEDEYRQALIPSDYLNMSNNAGNIINRKIAEATGLRDNGPIKNEGYLILFNKCPVPIAYLEIGFFDNPSDIEIINSSADEIGRAIAEGIEQYLSGN